MLCYKHTKINQKVNQWNETLKFKKFNFALLLGVGKYSRIYKKLTQEYVEVNYSVTWNTPNIQTLINMCEMNYN